MKIIHNTAVLALENKANDKIMLFKVPMNFNIVTKKGEKLPVGMYHKEVNKKNEDSGYVYTYNITGDEFVTENLVDVLTAVSEQHSAGVELIVTCEWVTKDASKESDYPVYPRNEFEHMSFIAFNRKIPLVEYDESWANETGYQNGFCSAEMGNELNEVMYIDGDGRLGYGMKTPLGNVTLFLRFTNSTTIVNNQPKAFNALGLLPSGKVTLEQTEVIMGINHWDTCFGERLAQYMCSFLSAGIPNAAEPTWVKRALSTSKERAMRSSTHAL